MRNWRRANRERARAIGRKSEAKRSRTPEGRAKRQAWEIANKEKRAAQHKKARNPERERDGHLRRTFGITLADEREMLANQQGRCVVCREPIGDDPRNRHVEHRHEPHLVRGIACFYCNTLIGLAHENPSILRAAADYLDEWERKCPR